MTRLILSVLAAGLAAGPAPPDKSDRSGDPLPSGAVARFGTIRLRHGGDAQGLAFLPGGRQVLSWSAGGVRTWDVRTGAEVRHFRPRPPAGPYLLRDAGLGPDGRTFVAVYEHTDPPNVVRHDGRVEVWDVATGELTRHFRIDPPWARPVLAPDGKTLALAGSGIVGDPDQYTVWLFDPTTGREAGRVRGLQPVSYLQFLPDGRHVLMAGNNPEEAGYLGASARIWDVTAGAEVRRIGLPDRVGRAALSADGRTLATTDEPERGGPHRGEAADHHTDWSPVRLWDVTTGKKLRTLPGNVGVTAALAFAPDGRRVWTVGGRAAIEWDVATGEQLRALPEDGAGPLALSADGTGLATVAGGVIRLRSTASGLDIVPPSAPTFPTRVVVPSADGRLTATTDGTGVIVWETGTGARVRRLDAGGWIDGLVWSPDGTAILANVSGRRWGETRFRQWDVAAGKEQAPPPGPEAAAARRLVAADARVLVTTGRDGAVVWDRATGTVRCRLPRGAIPVAITADGRRVLGTDDAVYRPWSGPLGREPKPTAYAWDAGTGAELHRVVFPRHLLPDVAFSPDGRWLAAEDTSAVVVYDAATAAEVRRLPWPRSQVFKLRFSPDGRRLAAGSWADGSVAVWDVESGKELHRFTGHRGGITAVAFTPDGNRLISCGQDTTTLVWDVTAVGPAAK